jgi:hypothetical protein
VKSFVSLQLKGIKMDSAKHDNSPQFTYVPLDRSSDDIRVLRLNPSLDLASPINCNLEHISMTQAASYEALSYCWEGNETPNCIWLNQCPFPVTKSLHSALLALCKPTEPRILWVDAVCLNQKDSNEKSREIWRMLDIYTNATSVVIWLGGASDDSDRAMDHLEYLSNQYLRAPDLKKRLLACVEVFLALERIVFGVFAASMRTYRQRPQNVVMFHLLLFQITPGVSNRQWWYTLPLLYLGSVFILRTLREYARVAIRSGGEVHEKHVDDADIRAIANFFSRSWFSRTWILQEAIAARSAVISCGHREMPLEPLGKACDQMAEIVMSEERSPYLHGNFQQFELLNSVIRHAKTESYAHGELLYLLNTFSHCGAGDDRDKVYGLLGLSKEASTKGRGSGALKVDYNMPTVDVYKHTARYLIETMGTLDVLRAAVGTGKVSGLPSWVPDWTTTLVRNVHGGAHRRDPFSIVQQNQDPHQKPARFSDDLSILTVQGFVVATISGVYVLPDSTQSAMGPRWINEGNPRDVMWSQVFTWLPLMYKAHALITQVLVFLITLPGLNWATRRFTSGNPDDVTWYWNMLANNPETIQGQKSMPKSLEGIRSLTDSGGRQKPVFKICDMQPLELEDKFWLTSCSTLADVRRGDLLCYLLGAKVPCILRKIDGHHVFVGPANIISTYVERLHWKNAVGQYLNKRLDLETFSLH